MAVVKPVGEPGKPELGLVDRNFHYRFLCNGDKEFKFHNGCWIIQDWISPAIVLDANGREILRTPKHARLEENFGKLVFRGSDLHQLYFYNEGGELLCAPRFEKHWLGSTRLPFVAISEGNEWGGMRGVLSKNGEWLVPPERAHFEITESDRVIKSKFGKFDKKDWKIQDNGRERELYAFLRDHNPIGMSKSQIESLLGSGGREEADSLYIDNYGFPRNPNVSSYQLNTFGGFCGSCTWFLELRYAGSRVKDWRIFKRFERPNLWIKS